MIRGVTALLVTTILWGSSFPIIKIVVGETKGFCYAWMRSSVSVLSLLPYLLYCLYKGRFRREVVLGGLITGISYALGLWLQGWGTGLTTASNSAFITGLNVVFVHLYVATIERRYSARLGIELMLAIMGLYLLTTPRGGFGLGDALVLASAVAWAAQVILVSKYGGKDPLLFTLFEMLPAIAFIVPDYVEGGLEVLPTNKLLGVIYLGLACSTTAFTLQAYGQRYVKPEIAALIFLLEPVFAALFSWAILGEVLTYVQVIGALTIMLSIVLATRAITRLE